MNMTLEEILESTTLSPFAKLAFVRVSLALQPDSDAIWGVCDPSEEFATGLFELAQSGRIRLEVCGNEYRVRNVGSQG